MGSLTLKDNRAIFFFDIDNCLYQKSRKVHDHMALLINKFFISHLSISTEDAYELHHRYYKDYGLAIEGLSRHHKVDPLVFNREVDDALPLDDLLSPDPELRKLLESFDKSKVKLWLFTNAHVTHGKRVVKLLGIDDLFEGITYCDYAQSPLVPKPLPAMFEKAEREAGATEHTKIYFVDDSHLNCKHAFARGWTNTVHYVEPEVPEPAVKACKHQVNSLYRLQGLFPELVKPDALVFFPSFPRASTNHTAVSRHASEDASDTATLSHDLFAAAAGSLASLVVRPPSMERMCLSAGAASAAMLDGCFGRKEAAAKGAANG